MNTKKLTVIVPFYNEEITLSNAVIDLINNLNDFELILVNDGSTDSSLEKAKVLQNQYPFIKIISNDKNQGKGAAVRLGLEHSSAEYVSIFDADLEYSAYDVKMIFNEIQQKNKDLICGSRFIGGLSRKNSYTRTYFGNKFLSFVFSKLYKIKVTDIATCLKIFKYELLQKFELNTNGFEIEVELISKSFRFTDKYGEVPISYSGRKYNQGKKIKTSDGFKYLYYMLKFLLK